MSIDLLRSRAVSVLKAERDVVVSRLRLCKPRSPITYGNDGMITAVVPPSGAEEIALFAVDINATVDAYEKAIAIIEAEFKKIIEPEQPAEEGQEPGKEKSFYG